LAAVDRLGIDDDFDAAVFGAAGGRGIGSKRVICTVSDGEELSRGNLIAACKDIKHGDRLCGGQLMGVRGIERGAVGISLDADLLFRVRTLNGIGNLIEQVVRTGQQL